MTSSYLVFGDLHGRILPAFRLAAAWEREHGVKLDGLLQVGDLGFFPVPERMDRATRSHAKSDPLELGARDVARRSQLGDEILAGAAVPPMWFVPGNHEDYAALREKQGATDGTDFPVDAYERIRCVHDGAVTSLPGGLSVGGLWGIDDQAPASRRGVPAEAVITPRSAARLAAQSFDVLLAHDSPRGAVWPDSGSEEISLVLRRAGPGFAFFGHYGARRDTLNVPGVRTRVYHVGDLALHGPGGTAEEGSVGLLRFDAGVGNFDYLDPAWLRSFSRYNWVYR